MGLIILFVKGNKHNTSPDHNAVIEGEDHALSAT